MAPVKKRCQNLHLNSNKYVKIIPRNGCLTVRSKQYLYEGEWLNDKREGFGLLLKVRSCDPLCLPKYKGNWHNNKRHGFGRGYFVQGDYYHGNWKEGKRHGYGRIWYENGSFYDGDWENDKRHGLGLFVEVNGNRYEGEWCDDKKHGFGRYYHLITGQMQEGVWRHDAAVCTTIEDIPFRQTVSEPTPYPISPVTLRKGPEYFITKLRIQETYRSRFCFPKN